MTRIIGPTGSKRRRRFRFLPPGLLLSAVLALVLAGGAQAVHDLHFQLDGDTTDMAFSSPSTNLGLEYDWNNIFNVTDDATANTQTVSVNSALVGSGKTFGSASFVRDFETNATCPTTSAIGLNSLSTHLCTADDTTYATGSKDTLGIGNGGWQCNHDNNVNSKIDIMNAYVLAYTASNGDKIFYFGVERNVSNGTNDVGVWFLQGGASCTSPTGSTNFTGQHQDGDTLVVAEQTSGGGVSTAKAFRWAASTDPTSKFYGDGGCIDSNDNYDPAVVVNGTKGCNNLPIATGADCKTTGGGDSLCATTNAVCPPPKKATDPIPACNLDWNQDVTTKWLTANGSSVGNTIVPPDFFEGGINITEAFAGHGGTVPQCFTTIVPDTRSSASPTATLFDYTLNQLGGCQTGLTTQENAAASREIGANGTISSGTDTATLTISGTPVWNGTLSFYLCGPDVTSCDAHGVLVTSTAVHSTDASHAYTSGTATLTSAAGTGKYCWHAHFEPDTASKDAGVKAADDDGTNECFTITPKTPNLSTSASCSANPCVLGSTLSDTATLSGTANNPNNDGAGGDTGLYKSINGTTKPADSSISWTLYGPSNSSCTTNVKLGPTTRTVSGDGTYPTALQTPVSYTPTLSDGIGSYVFVASYGGESPNTKAATSTTCSDSNETVTVIGTVSSASKQRWLPNDRVVLTTNGGALDGTLTVTLYSGTFSGTAGNCTAGTATAVPNQSYTFDTSPAGVPDASGTAYNTTNTTFFVGTKPDGTAGGAAGNYFWLVHYVDNNLTSPTDRCESSNVTITDG